MNIYHNTTIFKDCEDLIKQVLKIAETHQKKSELFSEIEKNCWHFLTNLASFLDSYDHHELQSHLNQSAHQLQTIAYQLQFAKKFNLVDQNQVNECLEKCQSIEKKLLEFNHQRKRVLILSSIMGQGHMSAANSVKQGLELSYGKNIQIDIVDFFEVIGPMFNKVMLKTYENSTKYLPDFYQAFFESTDAKWPIKLLNIINYPLNAVKIAKLFEQHHPDIIISTFPIWDYLASLILKKHQIKSFISVVTDSISIHNAWVCGKPDFHIVANQETAISLKKLGAKDEKIKILGFPVKNEFSTPINKADFLKKFKLNEHNSTIVFLPTAEKTSTTIKQIEEIHKNFPNLNLIVICGRNKELIPKLEKFNNYKNTRIVGWTSEMPSFIKSADIIITKAGGATVMECIAAQKPMIITQVIPGQEMGNAELIKTHNLGIIQKSAKMSITECLEYILKNEKLFKQNLKKISRPHSSLDIAKFIHSLL